MEERQEKQEELVRCVACFYHDSFFGAMPMCFFVVQEEERNEFSGEVIREKKYGDKDQLNKYGRCPHFRPDPFYNNPIAKLLRASERFFKDLFHV